MSKAKDAENVLRVALAAAVNRGMRIVDKGFGDGQECCCAVSAHPAWLIPDRRHLIAVADALGIDEVEIWAIVHGFDGGSECCDPPAFLAVGANLRDEFLPVLP